MLAEKVFEFISREGPVSLSVIQDEYFDNHTIVARIVKILENRKMIAKEWRSSEHSMTSATASFPVYFVS